MSRAVNRSDQLWRAPMVVILLLLVSYLTVKDLVDGLVFQSRQAATTAAYGINSDEHTHLDDLALSALQPAELSTSHPGWVFNGFVLSQPQPFFPFRRPPKF